MSSAAVSSDGKKDTVWYINCVVSVCIMLFFRFLPCPDLIQPVGWATIGIFIGCIYGWLTTSMIAPAIAGLIIYGFTSGIAPVGAWGTMMSNPLVALALWLMLGVGLLSRSGVAEWVGQWSVTREWTRGKPWALWFVVMVCVIAVGSVLNIIGALLVFWAIVHTICEEVGYEKGSKTGAFWTFCCVLLGTTASFLLPFQLAVVSNFSFLAAGSGGAFDGSFSYAAYLAFALIINIAALLGTYVLFRYIFKIDMSKFLEYDPSKHAVEPLRKDQKLSSALFLIMFLLLMVPSFLPKEWAVTQFLNGFGSVGSIMLVLMVALMIRFDGKPFINFGEVVSKNVLWEPIFLFGTAITLCTTINNPDAGVTAWIKANIGAFFATLNPVLFVILFMAFALILTNLINNAVVTAILVPISYSLSVTAGLNPVALVACFILFVDYAILLPSASPCGAMMWSNGGWIPKKLIYRYGGTSILMLFVLSLAIGWPLANVLF